MDKVEIHESVRLAWAIANTEACLSGRGLIEPVHFLLASLIIIDGLFEDAADVLELNGESVKSVFVVAGRCRALLKMSDDEVTSARRGLRNALRVDSGSTEVRGLHRSSESRYLLQKAGRRAVKEGVTEVTLVHLLTEILESPPEEAKPFFKHQVKHLGVSDEWPDYIPDPFIE